MTGNEKSIAATGVVLVFIALVTILITYITELIQCGEKWQSFPSKYSPISGCQIMVGDKWIPSESYYFKQE